MITIGVFSKSALVQQALAQLLTGNEYLIVTQQDDTGKQRLDLIIWDLRSASSVYPVPPDIPTLALIDDDDADKMDILNLGYMGYLSNGDDLPTLRRAIRSVLLGEIWAERRILSSYVAEHRVAQLTPREQQVHNLILEGKSNKEIARELDLAEKTVKAHVSGILRKFDAKGRMELIIRQVKIPELSFSER